MKASAYAPIIIMIVGTLLCIGVVVGIYIGLDQPAQARIQVAKGRYDKAYADSTTKAINDAKALLNTNTLTAKTYSDQWAVKERALMPPFDVSHRDTAWKQLSYEFSEHLGSLVEHWMAQQSDVKYSASVAIAAPPPSPNGITGQTLRVMVTSGGSFAVTGDFRSILSSVLKWNDFNRLMVIDQLQLHGNSPQMQATYSGYVVIFPQHADQLGQSVAKTAPAAAGGGGAAASGGYRGYGSNYIPTK